MRRTTLVSGLAAGAAGLGTYLAVVRPWHRRWGATDEELGRAKLPRTPTGALWYAVLDPGHFVMERKMLLEIKRRAEALAAVRATAGLASIGAA